MTRLLSFAAFMLGAAAVLWTAAGFAGTNTLAFVVTAVIGGVYLIGILELLQFQRATASLGGALLSVPAGLASGWADAEQEEADHTAAEARLQDWLGTIDGSLRNAVAQRIQGEREGLPAPVITPYLVGLLVMLGLLGTFVGMVDTLGGAVIALQGSTQLEAIRAGLAAPIQGLGVAFGTSVAGVAASAMLGMIATLARRERMLATRGLDRNIATVLHGFSLSHKREQAFRALQSQARALPAAADTMQQVATRLDQMGRQLSDALLANQLQLQESVQRSFTSLAASVESSLKESLAAGGRAAGDAIKPVVAEAMEGISAAAVGTQQRVLDTASAQLLAFGEQSATANRAVLAEISALMQANDKLLAARAQAEAAWLDDHGQRMEHLTATMRAELSELRALEQRAQSAAVDRLAELESTVTQHLTRLGEGLEAPLTRLIETASETPRAAAEVIGKLRAEVGNNIERDNQLLAERQLLITELNTLTGSLAQTTAGQREAVEKLVNASAATLQDVSARVGEHLQAETGRMSEASVNLAGSATELSSLGEAFSVAVDLFHSSNQTMIEQLARVEESLERSSTRSEEQMAYYVAQAREIIDQSMLSQREVIEDLRQLSREREDELRAAGAG